MKRFLTLLLTLALLLGLAAPALGADALTFYPDVPENAWYRPAARALYDLGVFPGGSSFGPSRVVTRLEFTRYLYRLNLAIGGPRGKTGGPAPFEDIPADGSESFEAVTWAKNTGVAKGVSATRYDPDGLLTREQCCVLLCRFAYQEGIQIAKQAEPALFRDSYRVSGFARSAVVACQMAGFLTGYADGTVGPDAHVVRSETAALLYRLYQALLAEPAKEYVSLAGTTYDACYAKYDHVFGRPAPENDPVDKSWFDDAVFIGDSVSVRLQMYCSSTGALGKATFLCGTSLSAPNAMAPVTAKSLHPPYKGVKQKIETSVAACGAKYVFIMLGMNYMYPALETSTASMVKFIGLIQQAAPDANIIIQSVTPLTSTSNITSNNLNNTKINQYNARMMALCAEHGWYYLDVASVFKNSAGYLDTAYCSDPKGMGIHFTNAAAKLWVDYLFTHIPQPLRGDQLSAASQDRVEEPPAEEEVPVPGNTLSLADVRQAMLEQCGAEDPLLLEQEALCGLYNLDESWIAQCAGFILMKGVFPDEIILVEAVDEAAAQEVALALQDKLDGVTEQARLYDPDSLPAIEQCRVVTDGLFVRLILSPDQADYTAVWDAAAAD